MRGSYTCVGETLSDLQALTHSWRPTVYVNRAESLNAIPLVLHQTGATRCATKRIASEVEMMLHSNPDVQYDFTDDAAAEHFMRRHFNGTDVLRAYHKLCKGAARADLWRYAMLYYRGGIYLDLDVTLKHGRSLRQLLYSGTPNFYDEYRRSDSNLGLHSCSERPAFRIPREAGRAISSSGGWLPRPDRRTSTGRSVSSLSACSPENPT